MKHRFPKEILRVILAFVLVIGLLPVTSTRVAAQNILGLMSASGVREGEGVVLYGDTTLIMDTDLTVPSIEGDYNLVIQGSGKLTVNGSGTGIDVKSLNCSSDLYIQTGWHAIEVTDSLYIQNAYTFINGGIYADGSIEIQSNNATIAGNGNAISSTGGNITLGGSTFDIGANGVAVFAETGNINMTGAFTVNSNDGRTIDAYQGAVTIEGSLKSTSGAKFDPNVSSANRDHFSIGAKGGFNFYGSTLEVEGLGGILAGSNVYYSDLSITAESVSIITDRYFALYGDNIYVDSDELWLENQGIEEDENVVYDFTSVLAQEDATLYSESGGIVGEYCVYAGRNLTLNGTFAVAADTDSEAYSVLEAGGKIEAIGTLMVRSEDICGIQAKEGFSFKGTTLDIEATQGIYVSEGDISIVADSTKIETSDTCAIKAADADGDGVGGNVYIESDYLDLLNLQGDDPNAGSIDAAGSVTLHSEEARLIGNYGIRADGDVTLDGNVVAKGLIGNTIYSEGCVDARGRLSLSTDGKSHCLSAEKFVFDGTTLTADGYAGIWGGETDIAADSVVITTDVGTALSGDEVYVTADYLWAENKSTKADSDWADQHGISATYQLALTITGGTVTAYDDALHVYDEQEQLAPHYIYVNGSLTVVSKTGAGMYVPQGVAEGYGGPIVSVGESHGIYADNVYFNGDSLRVDGDTGIYAASGVELSGEDIQITAFGERNSGIWCENGYVDLEGKVTIETGGWYGINSASDITFREGYYTVNGPEGNAQAVKTGGKLTLDSTLEIVKPTYGHVNGNDIFGAGDSPALELEMYSAISEVSLYIDGPREGKLPTWKASGIYFLDQRCTVEDIVWYEDGVEMSRDAKFIAGREYTVEITISADGVYHFVEGVMGKVNDESVSTGTKEKKLMYLTADMGECPKAVSTVELTITAPVEGNTPSTSVTDPSSEYGVYSRNVRWSVSTDGINYYSMATGEKFVGGKYYRVFMDVNLAGKDYKFPVTTASGSVQPDVVSYVNGTRAVTEKAYDQDPETVITVYFDFGKCNDFIIEEITIVDVVAPVAGQYPSYTAKVFATGYHVDTTKNAYEDIYWKNPPEKWYYLKNGISWWDVTDGGYDYVYENDVFLPGHQYRCDVKVCTDDGYEFVMDLYTDPETWPTATMNGNSAQLTFRSASNLMWEQEVTYTFTCAKEEVTTVTLCDLDAPQGGKTPDYDIVPEHPNLYTVDTGYGFNGMYWYDSEGAVLAPTDTFVPGEQYKVEIKLIPTKLGGEDACTFASSASAYINGEKVTERFDWDAVYASSKAVYIYYTFEEPASGPEAEPFSVAGVNLALNNDITLYLYLMAENYDASYTMEITKSYADGREVTKTVAAADWENYYGTMYRVGFNGIAAKEMTDEITVTVYDASGNAVSKEFVTTVADAAVLVYKSEANARSFTMMADLLNYGAAAQGNFRYNTDDLANTRLTAEQAAYASARFDMSTVTGKASGTAGAMGATLYLDTNIQHNFIFDAAVVDSTMTAKVSYTNYKGVANSFTIPGSRFVNNGSMITVNVSALTPADVNVPVTVQIVDANGAAVCSLTDSIAWYCVRAQASATNDLFIELMEFATSCNAYFG